MTTGLAADIRRIEMSDAGRQKQRRAVRGFGAYSIADAMYAPAPPLRDVRRGNGQRRRNLPRYGAVRPLLGE